MTPIFLAAICYTSNTWRHQRFKLYYSDATGDRNRSSRASHAAEGYSATFASRASDAYSAFTPFSGYLQ